MNPTKNSGVFDFCSGSLSPEGRGEGAAGGKVKSRNGHRNVVRGIMKVPDRPLLAGCIPLPARSGVNRAKGDEETGDRTMTDVQLPMFTDLRFWSERDLQEYSAQCLEDLNEIESLYEHGLIEPENTDRAVDAMDTLRAEIQAVKTETAFRSLLR